ncbi:MAG: ABC transporter ATP-binding protein [Planctomycetota bacterium]
MKSGPTIPINPADPAQPGAATAEPVVELRGVRFGYDPARVVLEEVSVALRPGRVTALLGPNASGKSTLLKVMLGQAAPWAGTATVHGQPVAALRGAALARRISYVPQRGGVSFAFSVREVVAMGRFAFGDDCFVDEALEKNRLADVAERVFAELSGGQQQRVLIARAWVQSRGTIAAPAPGSGASAQAGLAEAGVVLADEPASSLDLQHAHAALGLLREMADEGLAVVVVLHGLELAERWADEVWLMDRGRVVARGERDAVLRPEVLGPVYGVELGMGRADGQRVFVVRDAAPQD